MIHLIHGPDTTSSRNFLTQVKKASKDKQIIDARDETKESLWEKIGQRSLFGESLIIVDWFEGKTGENFPNQDKNLVVWSGQTLSETKWANKVSFFPNKSPVVFKLTDAFGARQFSLSQEFLEAALREKQSPDMLISMLTRQLKLISQALSGESSSISKSTFIQEKITQQAANWNELRLKKALRVLLEADLAIKNGLSNQTVLSLAVAKALL